MSGAIHGGLLIVIASFTFLLVRHAVRFELQPFRPASGLQTALLMLAINIGIAGLAVVLYAWVQHGIAALGVGLTIGAFGLGAARALGQRGRTQRLGLAPRTLQ